MNELVKLLNEREQYKKDNGIICNITHVYALNSKMEIVEKSFFKYLSDKVISLKEIISKEFWLIEWLIEVERIDWKKLYGMALLSNRTKLSKLCSWLLMQDDPIECLLFIIKK